MLYYKVPAAQALAQDIEPTGEGEFKAFGQILKAGVPMTSAILQLKDGTMVELPLDMVQHKQVATKSLKKTTSNN